MALIKCDFFSDTLGMSSSMHVILPQQSANQIGMAGANTTPGKIPCLLLLHGLSDDDSIWLRRTSIERYVSSLGIAVVMPNVHRSFYSDMKHGYKYWEFISEELLQIARSFFPLSDKREDNFVAGLSMGGYRAFKLALRKPESFSAAASLSGSLDIATHKDTATERLNQDLQLVFGADEKITGTENDLMACAEKVSALPKTNQPSLYQCCGTEDFLYEDNIKFRDHATKLGLNLTYEEGPGTHEWGYWDKQIQQILKWLPIS